AVRIAPGLPAIVDVDVSPAVVDEAAGNHRICGSADILSGDVATEAVPTIPTHGRRQCDGVAANDLPSPLRDTSRVAGAQRDGISPFFHDCAGDAARLRVQFQSRRQGVRFEGEREFSGYG